MENLDVSRYPMVKKKKRNAIAATMHCLPSTAVRSKSKTSELV